MASAVARETGKGSQGRGGADLGLEPYASTHRQEREKEREAKREKKRQEKEKKRKIQEAWAMVTFKVPSLSGRGIDEATSEGS